MLRVDDPLLSLILRFVISGDELKETDDAFIQRQIETLQAHVAQFPEADKEEKALEWIEQHAKTYRRNWEKKLAQVVASKTQCADCPMVLEGGASQCVIHQQWLKLLAAYCNDSISTKSYIKHSLALLQQHKEQLKLAKSHVRQCNCKP